MKSMKVLCVAGAAVLIAAVAGAETVNMTEFLPCLVFAEVDGFTDEHTYPMKLCLTTTEAAWVAVQCEDRGRTVLLNGGMDAPATAKVRLRVVDRRRTRYDLEKLDWGAVLQGGDHRRHGGHGVLQRRMLEGISAGERILFQVGVDVYRVTFDEAARHAAAVADFTERCGALDDAFAVSAPAG